MNSVYKKETIRKIIIRSSLVTFLILFIFNIRSFLLHVVENANGISRTTNHQICHDLVTVISIILFILFIFILNKKAKTFDEKSHRINKIR